MSIAENLSREPVSLETFYKEQQGKLLAFKLAWQKAHHLKPEDFPTEMLSGDWDDQLDWFDGNDFEIRKEE